MIVPALSFLVFLAGVFAGWRLPGYVTGCALLFTSWCWSGITSMAAFLLALLAAFGPLAVLAVPVLRRRLISARAMRFMASILPRLGETERIALEAGTVWWDGELFGGMPRWKRLLGYRLPGLSAREQAFLDGPVMTLCGMLDDWEITQRRELPPAVWDYLKEQRFFGMIIPEAYGGLGFSALANSRVVTRLSSRSITAAVTVMAAVPSNVTPLIARPVWRAVAVAAFPVQDPDEPEALPVTLPVSGPEKPVAVSTPVAELNASPLFVFGDKSPVAAVTNRGKQVVSADSSATVMAVGVPPPPPVVARVPPVNVSPLPIVTAVHVDAADR